jgi:hypothetical protein
MAEYSRIAKGHFTSTGNAQVVNLPFQPDRVEMINYTAANAAATSQAIPRAYWDVSMGQGFAVIEGYSAAPALEFDTITVGGFSSFAGGLLLQYGPLITIGASGSITSSSSTVTTIVTTANHGLTTGDIVVFQSLFETTSTGMQQFAGIPFMVTVTNATTFTINWNASGSNYTTITGGSALPNAAGFKQVLYPYLYAPGVSFIEGINTSTNTITTTAPHNYQVGQEVAFRITPQWGSSQLNSLPDTLIPGSPIYYYVTAVTQLTFTVSASLSAVTAFNPNQSFASYPGEQFPQAVAVGDINSGGTAYSGGNLYPSPVLYNGYSNTAASSINGPAILGAFVNNTSQGFVIGAGAGTKLTTAKLVGASTNVIYWTAYLSDLAVN